MSTPPRASLPFIYRQSGAEDLDAVQLLWEKLNAHHAQISPRFSNGQESHAFAARKQELIAKSDGVRILVELASYVSGGAAVAYCISTVSADGTGEVDSIFVEDHLRGQHIGSELMRHSLAWLDSMGATSKRIAVKPENHDAFTFYRRFNFHPCIVFLKEASDRAV